MNQSGPINKTMGLGVTHTTRQKARDAIRTHFASFVPAQVVTLTPEMCVRAVDDPEFRSIIESAQIVVADGVGVRWGEGRLSGLKPEKIPGIELAKWALEEVDRIAGRVYLLGSRPDVVAKTAEQLSLACPRLTVTGYRDGYFNDVEESDVVLSIASANPHLVLVGMGSPRQEIFINNNLINLNCGIAIGVGGTFDIMSGSIRRAPAFFRSTGTEWLYRTVTQPGERLARLPELFRFINLVLKKKAVL